jgi:hypothetical protein
VVVSQYNKPFIYNGNRDSFHIGSYCGISVEDRFNVATEKCHWTENVNIQPATKEQRDTLFKAMHEAGYMWNSESKQLLSLKAEPSDKQNPAWSEEDDMMIEETLYFLREYQQSNRCKDENCMQNSVTCEHWLKSLKQRIES